MPTIKINDFARRQTAASEFTHFAGSMERVAELALEHFEDAKGSYHQEDGVRLVSVPAEGFFCGVVALEEGDKLVGRYEARREGEEPRKNLRVLREGPKRVVGRRLVSAQGSNKSPCAHVDVVLYRRETLEAEGEPCTGADWDVISINGRLTEEEQPIHPDTLIANHFGFDGGTPTKMSPEEFEAALKVSTLYWKDKALLSAPGGR